MLYLSLYLKKHRDDYYRLLQEVRVDGDWEDWLTFFLTGVIETSAAATQTARRLLQVFQRDSEILRSEAASVIRLHQYLQRKPVISIAEAARSLKISAPTAAKALATLEAHSIVSEVTGQQYRKLYAYQKYLDVLNEDTL